MASRFWDADGALRKELRPGEIILWKGRPNMRATAAIEQGQFWVGLLTAGVGTGFLFPSLNDYMLSDAPKGPMGVFFGLLFFGFGLLSVLHGIRAVLVTRRTVYAVTDHRLLIVKDLGRKQVTTIAPSAINAVELTQGRDGAGSITFRRETVDDDKVVKLAFLGVHNVGEAAAEIEKLRLGAAAARRTSAS
jgi:hypothetical protein